MIVFFADFEAQTTKIRSDTCSNYMECIQPSKLLITATYIDKNIYIVAFLTVPSALVS